MFSSPSWWVQANLTPLRGDVVCDSVSNKHPPSLHHSSRMAPVHSTSDSSPWPKGDRRLPRRISTAKSKCINYRLRDNSRIKPLMNGSYDTGNQQVSKSEKTKCSCAREESQDTVPSTKDCCKVINLNIPLETDSEPVKNHTRRKCNFKGVFILFYNYA